MGRLKWIVAVAVGLTGALALSGCTESVEPLVGDAPPYSVWGYFNAKADTQFVRVVAVDEILSPSFSSQIDARVFSIDLETSERREWRHSVVTFDSVTSGHVFWSAFRAVYGHRYRLEVIRSDGESSTATARVPEEVRLDVDANPNVIRIPVSILGEAPRLVGIAVIYDALTVPPANPWPAGSPTPPTYRYPVKVPFTGRRTVTATGLELEINMADDARAVRDAFERVCLKPNLIVLRRVLFQVLVADESWTPNGGIFDPERLVEPGTMENVENGYGFVGAGFALETRWTPNPEIQRAMGYRPDPPCPMMAMNTPDCEIPPPPCFEKADLP